LTSLSTAGEAVNLYIIKYGQKEWFIPEAERVQSLELLFRKNTCFHQKAGGPHAINDKRAGGGGETVQQGKWVGRTL